MKASCIKPMPYINYSANSVFFKRIYQFFGFSEKKRCKSFVSLGKQEKQN